MQAIEIMEAGVNLRKQAALDLVTRGFRVFAVRRAGKLPDKLLSPHGHLGATTDAETVGAWFDVKPYANLGIACGESCGLVVLDVDVKNGARGMQSYAALELSSYCTLTARTPSSGFHLYFRYPSRVVLKRKHKDFPGIDIQGGGRGGYVVAPPSTLASGAYAWLDPEVPIAELPFALVATLEDVPGRQGRRRRNVAVVAGVAASQDSPIAGLLTNEGERHQKLLELVGAWRAKGLEAPDLEVLAWSHAERYFDPPFSRETPQDVREVEQLVHWVVKKPAGDAKQSEAWGALLPLLVDTTAEPYPTEALPGAIGGAVTEVAAFVQCPPALAACSALSVLSLIAQGLVNVRRGPDLEGPTSLYLLAVAESGERKSECDRRFTVAVRAWEADQAALVEPDVADYRAALAAWEAERDAVLLMIKQARKAGKPTADARHELARLERERPRPVRVPRLLLESETQESLAWNLARPDGWPSGGLLSSEAGIVLGGYAMLGDSRMRTMALLNKLWSGEPYRVGRRTSECFSLAGARLTIGLAVQPETVKSFYDDTQGLARGSGFLARFLLTWPQSRQGIRPYRAAPLAWPAVKTFERRLRELLELPLNFNKADELAPPPLELDPAAFEVWRTFHDGIEKELRIGGELAEARDVGAKAAENVARLAALFHLAERGPDGAIGAEHVAAAARIVSWHLLEARRVMGTLGLSTGASAAIKLNDWLMRFCRDRGLDRVSTREALQYGPGSLRRKTDLQAALSELLETNRIRLDENVIVVNAALLTE